VSEGRRTNLPEPRTTGACEVAPLVTAGQDAVVITADEPAGDGSGGAAGRFHEAHGGRARATPTTGFAVADVQATGLPERPLTDTPAPRADGGRTTVRPRPAPLATLRLKRA
jgi:alpha-mannosidase